MSGSSSTIRMVRGDDVGPVNPATADMIQDRPGIDRGNTQCCATSETSETWQEMSGPGLLFPNTGTSVNTYGPRPSFPLIRPAHARRHLPWRQRDGAADARGRLVEDHARPGERLAPIAPHFGQHLPRLCLHHRALVGTQPDDPLQR